jgi:hypothetical protein
MTNRCRIEAMGRNGMQTENGEVACAPPRYDNREDVRSYRALKLSSQGFGIAPGHLFIGTRYAVRC